MKIPELIALERRTTVPYRSLKLTDKFSLEGFSRAGVQTYFRVPEAKLLLDCGLSPHAFVSTPNLAITHCHHDHIGGLINYLATRAMQNLAPPRLFIPAAVESKIKVWLDSAAEVQNDELQWEFILMQPNDLVPLSQTLSLRGIETTHTIPSLGYQIVEHRHHLKDEYRGLAGNEIVTMKESGVAIHDEENFPLLAFTGDTKSETLAQDCFLDSEILMCEMSFFKEEDRQNAAEFCHVHLQDVMDILKNFRGKKIVFTHFSLRYKEEEIVETMKNTLTEDLLEKTVLWL